MRQRTGKAVIEYATLVKQHEVGENNVTVDKFLVHHMGHSRCDRVVLPRPRDPS